MASSLRHPARNYIHYLLSRRTQKIKDVVEHLSEIEIPLPQDKNKLSEFLQTLIAIQKNMRIPAGFDPTAKLMNQQTVEFLARWKITSIWRKDEFTRRASDLLFEPDIRRHLQIMLLGPLTNINIARRICARWSLTENEFNPRVAREYSHYYWDPRSMDQAQWKSFLFNYYPKFTENTDYAVALSVPRTTEGAMLTMSLSDRGADAMTNAQIYTMMRNQSAVAFMQHALLERPSIQRSQSMLSSINTFKTAAEELDRHRGASAELLDELRKMEPVYDRSVVATIHDLPIDRPVQMLVPDTNKEESP